MHLPPGLCPVPAVPVAPRRHALPARRNEGDIPGRDKADLPAVAFPQAPPRQKTAAACGSVPSSCPSCGADTSRHRHPGRRPGIPPQRMALRPAPQALNRLEPWIKRPAAGHPATGLRTVSRPELACRFQGDVHSRFEQRLGQGAPHHQAVDQETGRAVDLQLLASSRSWAMIRAVLSLAASFFRRALSRPSLSQTSSTNFWPSSSSRSRSAYMAS